MNMKPWEKDIQQMEKFFARTQEENNIKLNSSFNESPILNDADNNN